MSRKQLFNRPSDMEPLLPEDRDGVLAQLGLEVIRRTERLRSSLHPITRRSVADLVRSMNSYYSNLIEGHRTRPRDIDGALKHEFSGNATQRHLQQLHWAHVETERWMERRIERASAAEICSAEFICSLHQNFYERLPDPLRWLEDDAGRKQRVDPGKLRTGIVSVGRHVAPSPDRLRAFLERFAEFYGSRLCATPQGLVAAAAAHHRLAWIHPFLDGNGRVTRLFTQACLHQVQASGDGLWTLSRGLARHQSDYKAALANADESRLNDVDGRGFLSERRLEEFCEFLLKTAADQLEFMHALLDLNRLQDRITGYAERREFAKEIPAGSRHVLRDVFLRGQISRGEVARSINGSARKAQGVTGKLLQERLLVSDSVKGPVRLGLPADAAASYFPQLFPAGAD